MITLEEIHDLGLTKGDHILVKIMNQNPAGRRIKPDSIGKTFECVYQNVAPGEGEGCEFMLHAESVKEVNSKPLIYGFHDWLVESVQKKEATMNTTKALVKALLEKPLDREWTIQGLGMLRTYLDPEHTIRLHVWTTAHAEEVKASELHTHPWDFHSEVVAGVVHNYRYIELDAARFVHEGIQYQRQQIRCGEGGGLVGNPEIVLLGEGPVENYGDIGQAIGYEQRATEIHRSAPEDGTVTIIRRTFGTDTEHAFVYFPVGKEWITAEPRPATDEEILTICNNALGLWF